ncbi:hypothetical protein ACFL0M_00300 [Thermodesulfobacteriota bacterium]
MPTDQKDYLKNRDASKEKLVKDAAEAMGWKHPPEENPQPYLKVVK